MKIVVTGSAGRMGSLLCQDLLEANHEVIGLDVAPSSIKHKSYREYVGDLLDSQKISEALKNANTIVHLGAFMSWLPQDEKKLWTANVEALKTLLSVAVNQKVKKFVFGSTGEVYPDNNPHYLPINEEHPRCPLSTYGLTKKIGEDIVQFYGDRFGIETVILRFSHTQNASELLDPHSFFSGPRFFLGPKIIQQKNFRNINNVKKLEALSGDPNGLIISCNENGRPYKMHITDTRDIIQGIFLATFDVNANFKVFNLGSNHAVDFKEAVEYMAKKTNLPVYTVNFDGPGVFYTCSNDKIKKILGFKPVWDIRSMIDEALVSFFGRKL